MTSFNIAVLPGDGVGPEVMAEALKVMNAITQKYGHTFSVKDDLVGGAAGAPGSRAPGIWAKAVEFPPRPTVAGGNNRPAGSAWTTCREVMCG